MVGRVGLELLECFLRELLEVDLGLVAAVAAGQRVRLGRRLTRHGDTLVGLDDADRAAHQVLAEVHECLGKSVQLGLGDGRRRRR